MRYIIILLWLLLGPGYYMLSKNCDESAQAEETAQAEVKDALAPMAEQNEKKEAPCPRINAFAFESSKSELIKTNRWNAYKDSLVSLLTDESKIQIVGLSYEGENNQNVLAMARAKSIAEAISVSEERLQIYSSNLSKPDHNITCKIPGARLKLVRVTEKIKEIKDRTLIYFPYNSTKKLNDEEVENYLDALALKVVKTNERIRLTGHTDDKGEAEYNLQLGQNRSDVIKQYLISKNVPIENIISLSQGESKPIADNKTEEGRAQNRRTELEIIK